MEDASSTSFSWSVKGLVRNSSRLFLPHCRFLAFEDITRCLSFCHGSSMEIRTKFKVKRSFSSLKINPKLQRRYQIFLLPLWVGVSFCISLVLSGSLVLTIFPRSLLVLRVRCRISQR